MLDLKTSPMKELINKIKELEDGKESDDFNVFSMLQIENDEVRLHSRFLSYLFNHTSSHGCKNLFLYKLLDLIGKEKESFTVFPELILGDLGRADITLRNETRIILLENKVWSGLGRNQLERYSEYLNSQKQKEKLLVFLSPSKQDIKDQIDGVEIISITYKDISSVLSETVSEIKHPSLIEVLKQYIKICRKLSGENMEDHTNEEIRKILRENGAFNVYKKIWQAGVEESVECMLDFYNTILNKAPGSFLSRTERWGGPINLSLVDIKTSLNNYPDERFQGVNIPLGKYENEGVVHEYFMKIELHDRLYYIFTEYVDGKRISKVSKLGNSIKQKIHFKHDWVYPSKTLNWKKLVSPKDIFDKHSSLDIGYDFFDKKVRDLLAEHMIEEIYNYGGIITAHLKETSEKSKKMTEALG